MTFINENNNAQNCCNTLYQICNLERKQDIFVTIVIYNKIPTDILQNSGYCMGI